MERIAVIGGGLAGLVAARRLAERGIDVELYEATDRLGGRIGSDMVDGFILDRGFQALLPAYPAARRELDLGRLDLQSFDPGVVLARPGERSILADPIRNPGALTPTLFNRELTMKDKLRVLRLRRRLAQCSTDDILDDDECSISTTLAALGFSDRFNEAFAAPFIGTITLDRSLSSAAFVFKYVFKMLVSMNATIPARGMQAIPDQLAKKAREAGVRINLETPVKSLKVADGVDLTISSETITADGAVVATDPATAASLAGIGSIPTETQGCVTQYFALPTTQHLDLGKRLLLNITNDRPNHVAMLSAVANSYAPKGQRLLSATFLGQPDASDAELAIMVREALASWYPENSFSQLEVLKTHRIPNALLAHPPGFQRSVPAAGEPDGPVVLAGGYTRWSSIQGALESGRQAELAMVS